MIDTRIVEDVVKLPLYFFRGKNPALSLSLCTTVAKKNLTIGTHNIQNVTASSPRPGQISVTGDYVDGSTANGIILIVYSLSNYSDVQYVAKQIEKNIQVTVTDLTDTMYRVSVFALEDGLPFPRVVTVPKIVTVATDNDQGLCMQ